MKQKKQVEKKISYTVIRVTDFTGSQLSLQNLKKKNSRVDTAGNSSMENQLAEFLALPSLHKGQYHSITLVMREL